MWRHRRQPYDLVVYQMGNAECHNFMWAYLFRYPGLLVLHDAQLHQSRALWLLKRLDPRRDDYFAELRACHPEAPRDLGELVAAGLGGTLYQQWPMLRLVLRASRLAAVHNERLAAALREGDPEAPIVALPMGVADPGSSKFKVQSSKLLRATLGIPPDAIIVAAYGGITPEKRIPQVLRAVASLGDRTPVLHVLLVGARADHYDVEAEARSLGLEARVHVTGYVPDHELAAHLHAADIACCLRWPTNRETSASWLRCLAAGKPTLVTRLSQLADVPDEVATSIDVLDEVAALPEALERLAASEPLRTAMGERARAWWETHHQLRTMASAYVGLLIEARAHPVPRPTLPRHLRDEGLARAATLLSPLGISRRQAGL